MNRRSPPFADPALPPSATSPTAPVPVGWRRVLRDAQAWFLLPHAMAVLVVLATTYGFAGLARGSFTLDFTVLRLLMAMLGGQLAIGAVNEIVDADLDALSKPSKPIPAGIIRPSSAIRLTVISLIAMGGFSASFGFISLALCSIGTGAGLVYDLWLKRTLLSWLPYLVALPLLPIWVWTSLRGFEPRLLMLYPLGAFAVIGVHLSQALPDIAADRDAGVRGVSSLFGERSALLLCWTATLTAPALAAALAGRLTGEPTLVWIASVIVVAIVAANALLYAWDHRLGVRVCFPMTAISTAIIGLGWVLALR
ncbi:MAG TPA: UbiA family prenyltransferase [Thermomicrobiales bacterium]|nr:UbiA family prenyltransferase [Thermomicrobiales bacterium]